MNAVIGIAKKIKEIIPKIITINDGQQKAMKDSVAFFVMLHHSAPASIDVIARKIRKLFHLASWDLAPWTATSILLSFQANVNLQRRRGFATYAERFF